MAELIHPGTLMPAPLRTPLRRLGRVVHRTALAVTLPAAVLLVLALAWARQITVADAGAAAGLESDDAVAVTRGEWYVFRPKDEDPEVGLVFYPGGKADPTAYAPILHALAARGYLVVLPPMPLNLAILAPGRAASVMEHFPQITHWAIGGHSLGGVAASAFAAGHPGQIGGVVLWAAYPAAFTDLSDSGLPVLSVSASRDALATPEKIARGRKLLPPRSEYLQIQGGDHWNFGDFASGHGTALIARDIQQRQIVEATAQFLGSLAQPRQPGTDPPIKKEP